MKKLKPALLELIEVARIHGLNETDLNNANDYLVHNELGLCFDTIITQLYENEIEIDKEFYESISEIGIKMNLKYESYSFMKELIKISR